MNSSAGFRVALGGAAVVCCVHDREKRIVSDPERVAWLGNAAGIIYDPRLHKLHRCACCENLFVSEDDTPRLCHICSGGLKHELGGPLPDP
jgi:hypothetical protein